MESQKLEPMALAPRDGSWCLLVFRDFSGAAIGRWVWNYDVGDTGFSTPLWTDCQDCILCPDEQYAGWLPAPYVTAGLAHLRELDLAWEENKRPDPATPQGER